jgi:succinyl-diaminopimelate desuccinylase
MIEFIQQILSIDSPTFKEAEIVKFFKTWIEKELSNFSVEELNNNLIVTSKGDDSNPHICFVGHSDIVPKYFKPTIENNRLHGSGASDMKSAVGVFLWFLKEHGETLQKTTNISLIIYAREEGTAIHDNGLFEIIEKKESYIRSIDLAVVGEPTDNTIQLGCVGSIHATVTIPGIACHSARPWNGENALYNSLPFITYFSKLTPKKHTIFNVDFFDVISITECGSEPGRTSIPGFWTCNVNYRYSPNRSLEEAKKELISYCIKAGAKFENITIKDSVYAGSVIQSELFNTITNKIQVEKQAKQAWTDVAQLSNLNIPAFNFGPGLTAQAHKKDEYILISDIETYYKILISTFLSL